MKRIMSRMTSWLLSILFVIGSIQTVPIQAHRFYEPREEVLSNEEVIPKEEILPDKDTQSKFTILQVGDYVSYGTDEEGSILWRVKTIDKNGFLLYQEKFIEVEEEEKGAVEVFTLKGLLQESNGDLRNIVSFYIKGESIVFKVGTGTKENPYTIYEEWKELPTMKAKGNQVIIGGVELVGTKELWSHIPTIQVEGINRGIETIDYNQQAKTLIYKLTEPVKENERIRLGYSLPQYGTSAIAKVGSQLVIKEISAGVVTNETVDLKPLVITRQIEGGWVKTGDSKTFTVTAKGEGTLTFNWYKNDGWLYTEVKDSFNQEVSSSYSISSVKPTDEGIYKVEVKNDLDKKTTIAEVLVIRQYRIKTGINPIDGGSITTNSPYGDGVYTANEWATVSATPKSRYQFINWTENGKEVSKDINYTFKVTGDRYLIANFKWVEPKPDPIPQYTVYISVRPSEGGTIRGDYTYNKGDSVTVKARSNDGYIFESWTENDEVVSRKEEYTFIIKGDRRLKANFEKEKPKEKSFKEEWRDLTTKQQKAIKENFAEYLSYTTIDERLSKEQLGKLTKGYFTKKQIEEVYKDLSLLEDVGIDLDWKKVQFKKISGISFRDLPRNHWAYKNVTELAKQGIVTGYTDGTFKPNQALTVADTLTFLDRVLLVNNQVEMKQPRSIVEKYIKKDRSWSFNHVASIGSKLNDQTLKTVGNMGENYVSRQLLAQILFEVTNGELKKTKPITVFSDTTYSEYEDAIYYCVRTGLLEGTSMGKMEPYKPVTRAEMMTILQRLDQALK